MSERLIHVIRQAPSWTTGPAFTVCGNRSFEGDLTWPEMEEYIKKECRGSTHVAGATCCVTCLQNASREARWGGRRNGQAEMVAKYLTQTPDRKHPEVATRRYAELQALDLLVSTHRAEYELHVERIVGQKEWREQSKQKA